MTDEEFDEHFDALTSDQILEWLGKHIKYVTTRAGVPYYIENLSDLKAVVEQEMYERLTGRE